MRFISDNEEVLRRAGASQLGRERGPSLLQAVQKTGESAAEWMENRGKN